MKKRVLARLAVARFLDALAASNPVPEAHVFVVGHGLEIVNPIEAILAKKSHAAVVGILGFPEKMPPQVLELKRRGVVILDLERDMAGTFKSPLPHPQQEVSIEKVQILF